jgi:hypothetical protein
MTRGGGATTTKARGADAGDEQPVDPYRPPSSSDFDSIATLIHHSFSLTANTKAIASPIAAT